MSVPIVDFYRIPRYPLSNAVPFTFHTAQTYQELLEELRKVVIDIAEKFNSNNEMIWDLAADANKAIESALESVKKLTTDYYALLDEMTETLNTKLSEIQAIASELENALEAANEANATFSSVVSRINDIEKAIADDKKRYDESISALNGSLANVENAKVDKNVLEFNVLDFGAKGDGKADDTSAINAAISAAGQKSGAYNSVGAVIFFPRGTYRITSTIKVPFACHLMGVAHFCADDANLDGSIVKYEGTGNFLELDSGVYLDKMCLVGPGASTQTVGISSVKRSAFTIRDCQVLQFGVALNFVEVWYGHVENTFLFRNGQAGKITYCYNLSLFNLRTSCAKDALQTPGLGFLVEDRSMVTWHGGSVEGYEEYGIKCSGSVSVSLIGTYMETKVSPPGGGVAVAVGIDCKGMAKGTLRLLNCQIYQTNMRSWVECGRSTGQVIVSSGNTIKGGRIGENSMTYRVPTPNSGGLRLFISGDHWQAINDPEVKYILEMPSNSLVMAPYGTNFKEGINYTGPASFGRITSGGAIDLTGYSTLPAGQYMAEGSMVWDRNKKKLVIWDGGRWVDGVGSPA